MSHEAAFIRLKCQPSAVAGKGNCKTLVAMGVMGDLRRAARPQKLSKKHKKVASALETAAIF